MIMYVKNDDSDDNLKISTFLMRLFINYVGCSGYSDTSRVWRCKLVLGKNHTCSNIVTIFLLLSLLLLLSLSLSYVMNMSWDI